MDGFASAVDGLADKALFGAAVGEDALEGSPARLADALTGQLRAEVEEAPIFVADSGLSSAENVARLSAAGVRWISRVPDTFKEARAALEVADVA